MSGVATTTRAEKTAPAAAPTGGGGAGIDREYYLDRFPLDDRELSSLLELHESYYNPNDPFLSLSSMLDSKLQQQHQHHCVDSAATTGRKSENGFVAVPPLLPECFDSIKEIFRHAYDSAYVVVDAASQADSDRSRRSDDVCKFLEAAASVCGRRQSERCILDAIYRTAAAASPSDLARVVSNCVSVYGSSCGRRRRRQGQQQQQQQGSLTLSSTMWGDLCSTIVKEGGSVDELTAQIWRQWAMRTLPCLHQVVASVFYDLFFDRSCGEASMLVMPNLSHRTRFWDDRTDSIPIQLALMDLGGQWRRIYSSDHDGLSFRSFECGLISFQGPTLILIHTTRGDTLGYFSDVPWKASSPNWFSGEGESFLFRLQPTWNVYFPSIPDLPKRFHQFLNTPVSHQRNDLLLGLAVGGVAEDTPRLHLTMSLENCKACPFGSVFESGPLLGDEETSFFDVDSLEVWAVRILDDRTFEKDLLAGQLQASVKESVRQAFAKVDRRDFVDDLASGAYLNTLFQHRGQTRGRAEFVAANKEGLGYYYVEGLEPSSEFCVLGNSESNES
jgi:TLD